MEIIKKRICLEDFKSRIPSKKLTTITDKTDANTSWGNYVIKNFVFNEQNFKYGYIMNLYYAVLKAIMFGRYYKSIDDNKNEEYQLDLTENWRNHCDRLNINKEYNYTSYYFIYSFVTDIGFKLNDFKTKIDDYVYIKSGNKFYEWINDNDGGSYNEISGKTYICVINSEYEILEKESENINKIIGNETKANDLFQFLKKIHDEIGKYITPLKYNGENIEGANVPLFFYDSDLDRENTNGLLYNLEALSNKTDKINKEKYENLGGKPFLDYLKTITINPTLNSSDGVTTTINIPLLLTSELLDLGVYKEYIFDENNIDENIVIENNIDNIKEYIVKNSGESKLRGLFSRKAEILSNGNIKASNSSIFTAVTNENCVNPKYKKSVKNIQKIEIINADKGEIEIIGDGIYDINVNNDKIKYVYVIGGKFSASTKDSNTSYELIGSNPFESFSIDDINFPHDITNSGITINGMWYREEYDLLTEIDDNDVVTAVTIDFSSKEEKYEFDGIKYPISKYIKCNEILYTISDNEKMNLDNEGNEYYKSLYDEKMLGLTYPLKEQYNVIIDRGSSAAFEKHLQLTEVKTFSDLENYRNGSLFAKNI